LHPVILDQAQRDLVRLRSWSPWQADVVMNSIVWQARNGFGELGRPVYGGRFRWWVVPRTTQAIAYRVHGEELWVARVRDLRRLRRSVPAGSPTPGRPPR
jgi:hypothetical protein